MTIRRKGDHFSLFASSNYQTLWLHVKTAFCTSTKCSFELYKEQQNCAVDYSVEHFPRQVHLRICLLTYLYIIRNLAIMNGC